MGPKGGFTKFQDAYFAAGGYEREQIRNGEEFLEIHQRKKWAKELSTTEKVVTWQ